MKMKKGKDMKILVALLISALACCADACTAVIVGKKASSTGCVIVGHNNDGSGPYVMRYAMIPARDHAPGAVMAQEEDTAKIPQVPHTAACYWSEVKSKRGNPPPGDHFLNEHGVLIISNNGGVVKEWQGVKYELKEEGRASEVVDGGLKHNFRRAVIERAKTAREAVNVATNLIETWGYALPSRIFTIADRNEAWVLEVLRGRRYVARRCPDDAVVAYPNCLTIGKIEKGDIVAPALAAKGEDFHLIREYQGPRTWRSKYNSYRRRSAYLIAAGVDTADAEEYPFSVVPARKVSDKDVINALSSHLEKSSSDPEKIHPKDGQYNTVSVCRRGTMQSMVCVFSNDAKDTLLHVAPGRPCSTRFQRCRPFRGEMPEGSVSGEEAIKRLDTHTQPL